MLFSLLGAPFLLTLSLFPLSFHFEVNFSRKLSPVGILYLAGATLISSGSEKSISVFLWGTTPSPTLIHGVQGWAPGFIGELGQSAYSILLATAIVLWIPERPMRLTPGALVGIVGKEDLPYHWGRQLQKQSKLRVAAGHLCHYVQKAF